MSVSALQRSYPRHFRRKTAHGSEQRRLEDRAVRGEERRKLYASDRIALRDRVGRAYGILSNCSLLSYEEFLCLYTDLKLGLFLGILKGDIEGVNRLYFRMNDAALRRERKKGLSERELLAYRAEVLGMELELLIQKR